MNQTLPRPRSQRALFARFVLSASTLLFLLLQTAASPTEPRPRDLEALSRRTTVPLPVLREAHADAFLSPHAATRRRAFQRLVNSPRGELLGLVAWIAESEEDWPLKLSAIKALHAFGLLADRERVRALALPVLERHARGKRPQAIRWSLETLRRLNRWFHFDEALLPLVRTHFEGPDFNLRSLAFRMLSDMRNGPIRERFLKRATWQIYRSRRAGLFDRRQAVRNFVRLSERKAIKALRKNLQNDGRLAVVSAWALGRPELLDRSSLRELRRVDATAVHSLRRLAWRARCRLDDPRCLSEIERIVLDRNEHDEIKRSFLADLGWMREHAAEARSRLRALSARAPRAALPGIALGLLRLGEPAGVELLVELARGPWPDDPALGRRGKGWMRRFRFIEDVLRTPGKAIGPVLIALASYEPSREELLDEKGKDRYERWFRHGLRRTERMRDWYDEYRSELVRSLGERRIAEAKPLCERLSARSRRFTHTRFEALISRIELGDPKARDELERFLPYYDDAIVRRFKAVMGPTTLSIPEMRSSTIFGVCAKFERVGDATLYLPLCELLLEPLEESEDPMRPGWARAHGLALPAEGDAPGQAGSTSVERDGRAAERAKGKNAKGKATLIALPEVHYRLQNQFARRRVVVCAARLGGQKAAPILARALRDARTVVRAAALIEIGRLSGAYTLEPGCAPQDEARVWPLALKWLAANGSWPD